MPAQAVPIVALIAACFALFIAAVGGAHLWTLMPSRRRSPRTTSQAPALSLAPEPAVQIIRARTPLGGTPA